MKKAILTLSAIVFTLTILLMYNSCSFKYKRYYYANKNIVENTTQYESLDSLVHLGLNIVKIQNVHVKLKPIPANKDFGGWNVRAYIKKRESHYDIYFANDLPYYESIETVAHELIHLVQYHTGTLVETPTYWVWKGDTIQDITKIPYMVRPWEEQARSRSIPLTYGILSNTLDYKQ